MIGKKEKGGKPDKPPEPDVLARIAARRLDIPTMPVVLREGMELLGSSTVDMHKAARVLSDDPGAASLILRISNSAYYSFAYRVSTISHALSLIGSRSAKNTLGALALRRTVHKQYRNVGIDLHWFWLTAVLGAAGAERAAMFLKLGNTEAEECMLACLLRDLGYLVLLRHQLVDPPEEGIPEYLWSDTCDASEHDKLDYSHADVTMFVCHEWGIPYLGEMIMGHHRSAFRTQRAQNLCVRIGQRVAALILSADRIDQDTSLGVEEVLEELEEHVEDEWGLLLCALDHTLRKFVELAERYELDKLEFNKAFAVRTIRPRIESLLGILFKRKPQYAFLQYESTILNWLVKRLSRFKGRRVFHSFKELLKTIPPQLHDLIYRVIPLGESQALIECQHHKEQERTRLRLLSEEYIPEVPAWGINLTINVQGDLIQASDVVSQSHRGDVFGPNVTNLYEQLSEAASEDSREADTEEKEARQEFIQELREMMNVIQAGKAASPVATEKGSRILKLAKRIGKKLENMTVEFLASLGAKVICRDRFD